jgi:hypothetical protein
MKRYIYLLIIIMLGIFIYNLWPTKEHFKLPPDGILKVELVPDPESAANNAAHQAWNRKNQQNQQNQNQQNQQNQLNQQKAAQDRQTKQDAASAAECASDENMVKNNTASLATIPSLLQSALSTLSGIQSSINANTNSIQDASGIINNFINQKVREGKARTAEADALPHIGPPSFVPSSNPIIAAIQLFSGGTKSA